MLRLGRRGGISDDQRIFHFSPCSLRKFRFQDVYLVLGSHVTDELRHLDPQLKASATLSASTISRLLVAHDWCDHFKVLKLELC